ncbi:MAG: hypothetical protein K8R36_24260, partial [Planctomycetales bacterium]|nr:hypothetical protein [Planctomycetales bacterium]
MHDSGVEKTGILLAAAVMEDAKGTRVVGDYYPLTLKWQTLPLDLRTAVQEGASVGEIAAVGVSLKYASEPEEITLQTDQWALRQSQKTYVGSRTGPPKSFYVDRQGGRLAVGQVDQWEMTFHRRSSAGEAGPRGWLEVTRGKNQQVVMGSRGTGLMVLDQEQYDGLVNAVQRVPVTAASIATSRGGGGKAPVRSWPGGPSMWDWRVGWTSEVAAVIEVKQTCGPFDRLGRPAATLLWRFMAYRSGQVYVHVEWNHGGD